MTILEIGIAAVSALLLGLVIGGVLGLHSAEDIRVENVRLAQENKTLWRTIDRISQRRKERA